MKTGDWDLLPNTEQTLLMRCAWKSNEINCTALLETNKQTLSDDPGHPSNQQVTTLATTQPRIPKQNPSDQPGHPGNQNITTLATTQPIIPKQPTSKTLATNQDTLATKT